MCERQIQIRDANDKICTKQRTSVLTGQHRSTDWAALVRPVSLTGQTGQVQPTHRTGQHRSDRCP
jgi:hypothetical protein